LETGKNRVVAQSRGWGLQVGANINWGGDDSELFFNDVDMKTWQCFSWKLDPNTGKKQKMDGTVYHASPDGKWLISANLTKMRKTQSGYGIQVPDEYVRRNVGAVEDDGFFLTDTSSGKSRMLVSIADMFSKAEPCILMDSPNEHEIYGFHCKFNPQGNRLMLSLRWYPKQDPSVFEMFNGKFRLVRYAWITMPVSAEFMHCAVGPEHWEKGGHHATWFPDGERISMNLNIEEDCMRFVSVDFNGNNLRAMREDIKGSGHPTVHPNNRNILTDAYLWEKEISRGDGTLPLRWINLETGKEQTLVHVGGCVGHESDAFRLDLHPAWDRSWRFVTFNGYEGGTRRVFLMDLKGVV
jgi:hypothetical protein